MSHRKLKILLVIDSLGAGGAQRQMSWLAAGLAGRGHAVTLFNYYPALDHFRPELEGTGVELVDVFKQSRFDTAPLSRLRALLAEQPYDILLSFLNTPNVYSILATLGRRVPKLVVSERLMFPEGRLRTGTWARYQSYRFADAITVNSYHQRDRILEKFPWSAPKLTAIWNGVDLAAYRPVTAAATGNATTRFLAVGSVVPQKNAPVLVRALAEARSRGLDVQVDWAGKTPNKAASLAEYQKTSDLVDELGLKEHWRWLGNCSEMNQLYPRYDALVHPSYLEGLPNAICEALASGLPVIASSIGDHKRLVDRGNGWVFEHDRHEQLADLMAQFANMPVDERREMGDASRSLAEARLSRQALVDKYEYLLTGLYENRPVVELSEAIAE